MVVTSSHLHPALLLTGMAVIALAGCEKKDDGAQSIATSSASESRSAADSAAMTVDTGPAAPAPPAVTPPADTPAKAPARPAGLPKPSIDPGRKTPAPRADPRPKPAADSSTNSAAAAAPAPAPSKGLSYDPATNTVTFDLIAGPFTFNGARNGESTLTVPSKANLVINFVNKDGTPHSAEVISGEGAVPNSSTDPAIPRAYTNKALEGLPQEASDVMRFPVPESGTYRIFCGVPGHGLSGMWIWLKVDPAAKTPSFGPTKA
jgi:plastocyanin